MVACREDMSASWAFSTLFSFVAFCRRRGGEGRAQGRGEVEYSDGDDVTWMGNGALTSNLAFNSIIVSFAATRTTF